MGNLHCTHTQQTSLNAPPHRTAVMHTQRHAHMHTHAQGVTGGEGPAHRLGGLHMEQACRRAPAQTDHTPAAMHAARCKHFLCITITQPLHSTQGTAQLAGHPQTPWLTVTGSASTCDTTQSWVVSGAGLLAVIVAFWVAYLAFEASGKTGL